MHMVHAYRKFPQATVFCWVGVGGGGDLGLRLVFLHMGGRHWRERERLQWSIENSGGHEAWEDGRNEELTPYVCI